VAAENTHDLDAIMATFSPHAIVQVNDRVATTPEGIAAEYERLGLSARPGWLSELTVVHEHEHFTDQDIAYEAWTPTYAGL
jgi:ligand-binding SRPBCC domain-containing protein